MEPIVKARAPFRFYTSVVLPEATGLRAATLPQLVKLLQEVPDGCIYYHTHYFLLAHHYLTPEPTNDVAYWVTEVLGEASLGERLAGIDIMQFSSLPPLRDILVRTITDYLDHHAWAQFKFVSEGEEFFFVKSVHLIVPTALSAVTLAGFAEALAQVSIYSLYFHVFDARLKLGALANDFSRWLEEELGEHQLAQEIAALDPYVHTLETLRAALLFLIRRRLSRVEIPHGPVERV